MRLCGRGCVGRQRLGLRALSDRGLFGQHGEADCIVTNPPFDLKAKFLVQAKRLGRHKVALLLPVEAEHTMEFVGRHLVDADFPWKAPYSFPQGIQWANVQRRWVAQTRMVRVRAGVSRLRGARAGRFSSEQTAVLGAEA